MPSPAALLCLAHPTLTHRITRTALSGSSHAHPQDNGAGVFDSTAPKHAPPPYEPASGEEVKLTEPRTSALLSCPAATLHSLSTPTSQDGGFDQPASNDAGFDGVSDIDSLKSGLPNLPPTSPHLSPHLTLPHLASPRLPSPHPTSPHPHPPAHGSTSRSP